MRAPRRLAGPLSLLGVLALALLVGSGAFDEPAPAAATRVAGLERIVRCPSCTDLSVAQSNSASSISVRREIAAGVRSGKSDREILDALQGRYGPSILLVPPASALTTLLWWSPVALGTAAACAGAVVVVRRRRGPR